MTNTATLIRTFPTNSVGAKWRHYSLSEPIEDYDGNRHSHVIVSAVVAMFSGPETYIFAADETGEVVDFSELPGSYRGGMDHEAALARAGYSVQ